MVLARAEGNTEAFLNGENVAGRAKVSAFEEPDAGKPHVRVCAGGRLVTDVPTADTKRTVKLWESPRQSRGLPFIN